MPIPPIRFETFKLPEDIPSQREQGPCDAECSTECRDENLKTAFSRLPQGALDRLMRVRLPEKKGFWAKVWDKAKEHYIVSGLVGVVIVVGTFEELPESVEDKLLDAVEAVAKAARQGARYVAAGASAVATAATTEIALGTAAIAGIAVAGGLAVGGAIHYSGLGEVIGTNQAGEEIGDRIYDLLHSKK